MWYVEYLLLNKLEIEASEDLESDALNDLLIVEKAIQDLNLPEKFITVCEALSTNPTFQNVDKLLNRDHKYSKRLFTRYCKQIGNYLGGVFTDEGYLEYLKEKYNFSEDKMEQIEKFIKSESRFDLSYIEYTDYDLKVIELLQEYYGQ